MSALRAKLQELDRIISEDTINMDDLRQLCFQGIPESTHQSRRSLCWKILLNYLPLAKSEWTECLEKSRNLYRQFVDEMIVTPGQTEGEDHPLSLSPDSQWQAFFRDNEVLQQIDKDVRRLCPDISFFQQASDFPCLAVMREERRLHARVQRTVLHSANVERKGLGITKIGVSVRKAVCDYAPLEEGCEAHWEVVERILFLYAKLNPGQGYVQGMNEIIGPIYYTFASDSDPAWREHAEADCFFCFTNLMAETRDLFMKSLDDSEGGIQAMMGRVTLQLEQADHATWAVLTQQHLRPEYYSFRWITLLLSQEFPLPDVLRIWDSLLADPNRFDFLVHICCAMITLVRDQILSNEFSSNVKLLQNFPPIDVQVILSKAAQLAEAPQ